MLNEKFKFTIKLFSAVIITLGLSISFQSLLAQWSAPQLPPPDDNVAAPINIGSDPQTKTGSFTTNQGVYVGQDLTVIGEIKHSQESPFYINSYDSLQLRFNYDSPETSGVFGINNQANNRVLTILDNGNVGVGVPAPTEKLDINGNINVNNNTIINLITPVNDTDAVNKAYVDQEINDLRNEFLTPVANLLKGNTYLYKTLGAYKGDIGGRVGVDGVCFAELPSELVGVCNNVKSFITINNSDEIRDLPNCDFDGDGVTGIYDCHAPLYFYDRTNQSTKKIADNWGDLLDGTIMSCLSTTCDNNPTARWRSNSRLNGGIFIGHGGEGTCYGMTSEDSAYTYGSGVGNYTNSFDKNWIEYVNIGGGFEDCDVNIILMCACDVSPTP